MFHHILIDFIIPVWPNIAASAMLGIPALWWQHSKIVKRLEEHHGKQMAFIEKFGKKEIQEVDKVLVKDLEKE